MNNKHVRVIITQLCLVFCITTVSLSSASAEVQLSDYFRGYAELENDYGAYTSEWPLEAKTRLVRLMLEQELIPSEKEEASRLLYGSASEMEQDMLASKIIKTYYKDALAMNTYNIMLTELGQMEEWSYEAKALYSSLLVDYGNQKQSWDLFLLPTPDDISFEEAKETSINTLCEKFSISREALLATDTNASFYQKGEEREQGNSEPVWLISFGSPDYGGGLYYVELSRQGEILMYKAPDTLPFHGDHDILAEATLATPSAHDASAKQVIGYAKELIGEAGNYSKQEMEAMRAEAYFIYHERFCNSWEPVWIVDVYQEGAICYSVLLGYDGSLIDLALADDEFEHTKRSGLYIEDVIGVNFESFPFHEMTHEERAEFSKTWNPILDAYILEYPYYNPNNLLVKVTRHVYGIPVEKNIAEDEAKQIVEQIIAGLGADPAGIPNRTMEFYFDITNADAPKWNVFVGHDLKNSDFQCYRVVLNAMTGERIEAFELDVDMLPSNYRM